MERLLQEIEALHGIKRGSMRAAISQGKVAAQRKGGILVVDDEDEKFLTYKRGYKQRAARGELSPSSAPRPPLSSDRAEVSTT